MIIPARDGTLRVLRAAREAGVKRVVITSSTGAIGYGHQAARRNRSTRLNWTNLDGGAEVQPYVKSKTLAERAAWDFIVSEGGGLELSVINPVGISARFWGRIFPARSEIVKALLDGAMPAVPRIYFGLVDVRDVADLHLRAMTSPGGKRRALHRGGRRDAVDSRHRKSAAAHDGRVGRAGAAMRGSRLAGAAGGARGSHCCGTSCAMLGKVRRCQRRQGEKHARLEAARQRGDDHCPPPKA